MLHRHLSILFTSMINHGYAPPEFLHSSMIPLPKGARADLSNSDMYRSIAISSLLSKIFDNVVIERQLLTINLALKQNYQQSCAQPW